MLAKCPSPRSTTLKHGGSHAEKRRSRSASLRGPLTAILHRSVPAPWGDKSAIVRFSGPCTRSVIEPEDQDLQSGIQITLLTARGLGLQGRLQIIYMNLQEQFGETLSGQVKIQMGHRLSSGSRGGLGARAPLSPRFLQNHAVFRETLREKPLF